MDPDRDPVAESATDSADLYDVATWERRSWLDAASTAIYGLSSAVAPYVAGLFVLLIVVVELVLFGVALVSFRNPVVAALVLLSIVPAFGLAAYIWYADVTTSEPLSLLAMTFLLGVLLASFAAVINTTFQLVFSLIPLVGTVLFYFFVVAPVEETVKWLAVRLYAFRSDQFDAVVDGAVYGAVAGLGFATIENALYITQGFAGATAAGTDAIVGASQTAAARLLAGPGHVIYSAFAGYYLGLAKFNRDDAGPIVIKGLLIAAFIHATYNSAVTYLPAALELLGVAVAPGVAFLGFVVVYDGVFGYLLYRKIARYRNAYRQVDMNRDVSFEGSEDEAFRASAAGDAEASSVDDGNVDADERGERDHAVTEDAAGGSVADEPDGTDGVEAREEDAADDRPASDSE
ncbi:PrsW family intramembrane metalloprotease [Halorussus halobius]|uniref:PrsW family intramembrane metalloprotease n=1 Tax=Halorussus halobius TaxID=1710537 RepID=UPI001092C0FC|nr:PrsW family intramembrane metalloprotease [Halorussus halobius]